MALTIRRGATKTLLFYAKQCSKSSKDWTELGTLLLRFKQGNYVLDKVLVVNEEDPTIATVKLTQEETIRYVENRPVDYQLFSILGPESTEVAAKSDVFKATVLPTIFEEVIHNE